MAFFKSLIIASVAAVAFAAPQGAEGGKTEVGVKSQSSAPKCGNGQKIACCNSGEDLIGLNCLSVPIRMFSTSFRFEEYWLTINPTVAIPIQQACGSNVAACCQTGDAEVSHPHPIPSHPILPSNTQTNITLSQGNLINLEANCIAIPL
jgi:hypothetical protein